MASNQIIKEGKPKLENIMQICLYLLEIKNGKKLKEIIKAGVEEKIKTGGTRNRIDANMELVDSIDDGCVGAKLVYVTRDTCDRKEFDITIEEDFDGSSYPCIDGMMWKIFTVESIYERYKTLQKFWYVARNEAVRRLAAKGIHPPPHMKLILGPEDNPNKTK
jgi:hypothetical protein